MTELRCADVEARFVDAADGRLDPADSVRFHSHIEGCAACRERASLWLALIPGLRDAVPTPPGAMTARRMQIEVERQVARRAVATPERRWRAWWVPAFGLTAAAAVVLWMRAGNVPSSPQPVGYAALQTLRGAITVGDHPSTGAARVPIGQPIVLSADAGAQLALDSGAIVRAQGPAHVVFEGSARDVAIRLVSGKLEAEVAHRRPGETFAVVTAGARVVVRGTKFSVAVAASGSHVAVSEGRVSVELAGGRTTLVSAGESFDFGAAGDTEVAPPPAEALPTSAAPVDCAEIIRSCQTAARAGRASMRGGEAERALRIVTEARRAGNDGDSCGGAARACEDELRYLRAEALNQGGRLDEAVGAYHALDRRNAPSAMRQNALYAAAQIEKRTGRLSAASADFERALAVAPRGALYEDALVGAMETARAAGDDTRARAFATRYLSEFPRGLAAPAAKRLAGDGTRP